MKQCFYCCVVLRSTVLWTNTRRCHQRCPQPQTQTRTQLWSSTLQLLRLRRKLASLLSQFGDMVTWIPKSESGKTVLQYYSIIQYFYRYSIIPVLVFQLSTFEHYLLVKLPKCYHLKTLLSLIRKTFNIRSKLRPWYYVLTTATSVLKTLKSHEKYSKCYLFTFLTLHSSNKQMYLTVSCFLFQRNSVDFIIQILITNRMDCRKYIGFHNIDLSSKKKQRCC